MKGKFFPLESPSFVGKCETSLNVKIDANNTFLDDLDKLHISSSLPTTQVGQM